eukprot:541307_1
MGVHCSSQLKCISAPHEHKHGNMAMTMPQHRQQVKLLFLDVDGVLNGESYGYGGVVDSLLLLLKQIIDQTNCKIVLSTTWRLHQSTRATLLLFMAQAAGINVEDIIIGDTPSIEDKRRAFEIESFLKSKSFHSEYIVKHWCAIDDMNLNRQNPAFMKNHFVRTNYRTGMTGSDALKVIRMLNG